MKKEDIEAQKIQNILWFLIIRDYFFAENLYIFSNYIFFFFFENILV